MNRRKATFISAIVLLVLGVVVVLSAYYKPLWAELIWDIRAVGLGISIIGVSIGGLALYISLEAKGIARESDKRMAAMANLEFHEKIAIVENYIAAVKSRNPVVAKSIKHDLTAAKQLNSYVDDKIKNELDNKIDELKKEATKEPQKYEDLTEELTNL